MEAKLANHRGCQIRKKIKEANFGYLLYQMSKLLKEHLKNTEIQYFNVGK